MKKVFNITNVLLLAIIVLGLVLRLYKIDSPIADWHSWRQADTAAVTRNFIQEGFNPLFPKYDDMSGVSEKPIPNLARFRFVEFPIYNIAVYPFYSIFGINEMYSRLVSVLFAMGSIIFIFLITKKYQDKLTALLASLVFALLPYNIFFSRTTLPEPTFIFFALGMVYFVDRWIDKNTKLGYLIALIFSMIAFLIKPWAIFFAIPLVYLMIRKEGIKLSKKYILFIILTLLPFLLWRLWILQHPEGIPASNWLSNGDAVRFRPAFWWWIVSERLGREILSAAGIVLFFIGAIIKPKDGNYFLHIWLLSLFLYFIVFATGNVRHDYYQMIFIPIASIFLARGVTYLIAGQPNFVPRIWTIMLALIFLPLTFYFGWMQVKDFYNINNPAIIEAGKAADKILPKDAIVLAPYNGDTAFLYQINRPGWAIGVLPTVDLVANYGVTSYVSTAKDAKTNWVMRHFKVLEENDSFVIVDLTKLEKDFSEDDPEP